MACTVHTFEEPDSRPLIGRPMTRCECADLSFEDAVRHLPSGPPSVEELVRRTGCGGNCTACIPDLRRFLHSRAR